MIVMVGATLASDPLAQTCHQPSLVKTCEMADRAADEQIAELLKENDHLRRLLSEEEDVD